MTTGFAPGVAALVPAILAHGCRPRPMLVLLAVALLVSAAALPPPGSGYATILVGGTVPTLTAEYVAVALVTVCILGLAPIYLVMLRVLVPVECHPLALVAFRPSTRVRLWCARWIVDLLLLTALLAVMGVAGLFLLTIRGVEPIRPGSAILFVGSLVVMGLPGFAVLSAVRLALEMQGWLRGRLGLVVFLVLWVIAMTSVAISVQVPGTPTLLDPFGVAAPLASLGDGRSVAFGISSVSAMASAQAWGGFPWTGAYLMERLTWVALAMLLVAGSGALTVTGDRRSGLMKRRSRGIRRGERPEPSPRWHPAHASDRGGSVFAAQVWREIILATRPWAWRLAAVGTFAVAQALGPDHLAMSTGLALAVGSFAIGDLGVRTGGRRFLLSAGPGGWAGSPFRVVVGCCAGLVVAVLVASGPLSQILLARPEHLSAATLLLAGSVALALLLGRTGSPTPFLTLALAVAYAIVTAPG